MFAIDRFLAKKPEMMAYFEKHKTPNKLRKKVQLKLFAHYRQQENFDYHIAKICEGIIKKS